MNKVLLAVLTALLLVAGPAYADPYPATVDTTTEASGAAQVKKGHRPTTKVKVRAGNAKPSGKLELTYERNKGGFRTVKTAKYSGKYVLVEGPKLSKLGKYTVKVKFIPPDDSVYKPSSDSYGFKVVT